MLRKYFVNYTRLESNGLVVNAHVLTTTVCFSHTFMNKNIANEGMSWCSWIVDLHSILANDVFQCILILCFCSGQGTSTERGGVASIASCEYVGGEATFTGSAALW